MITKASSYEDAWAKRHGIVCKYPDGADRCVACPHYLDPKKHPDCVYAVKDSRNMNHNRAHAVPLRLIDGGIVNVHRSDIVKRMAADLVRYDAFHNEHDAIRSLFGRGYGMGDIVMCVDDARQAAVQELVAAEMVKP